MSQSTPPRNLSRAVLCAFLLAFCVLAAMPFAEIGINDDWSYVWSARDLAATGHVHYNGWATAMLGWQLYMGAALVRLFGFSFSVVRAGVLGVAMLTAVLLHRLLLRLGLSAANATVTTLAVVLSPVFLPLSFSFMSDVPGFACLVLCFYLCVRAVQAGSSRQAALWLVAAALTNALDGTVRQIVWLGTLLVVPATGFYLRRRRGVFAAALLSSLAGALIVLACMYWFQEQPYAIVEKLIMLMSDHARQVEQVRFWARAAMTFVLLLLPITAGFLWWYLRCDRRARRVAVGIMGAVSVVAVLRGIRHKDLLPWYPLSGNILGLHGVMDFPSILGERPGSMPPLERLLLAVMIVLSGVLTVAALYALRRRAREPVRQELVPLPSAALLAILGPFCAAYFLLLITREGVFDRYLLPLVLVAAIVLVRFYQSHVGGDLPRVCLVVVVLFAGYSILATHDLFALERARVHAADEVLSAGVDRLHLQGGFEYDAWTELELRGYVNDPRIHVPAEAFHPVPVLQKSRECVPYFYEHTPDVKAQYFLAFQPLPCYRPTNFAPVNYTTWLPPFHSSIVIEQAP